MSHTTNNHPSRGTVQTNLTWWGELHHGTEQALKALGLGVGQPFPTKAGHHHDLKTLDPRGLPCVIGACLYEAAGIFFASIYYPDRAIKHPTTQIYPGVTVTERPFGNVYKGTGEALDSAGIVPLFHLPGMPGMRKTRVTILPDGQLVGGSPQANPPKSAYQEGAKQIEKAGKLYIVTVRVSDEERKRRLSLERAQEDLWMRSPRPRSLFDLAARQPSRTLYLAHCAKDIAEIALPTPALNRPGLRLVYSATGASS